MGLWGDQVVPRLAARLLDNSNARRVRAAACEGLTGEVLEIGFGSGLNVPHYPPGVTRVSAVEPSDVGWRLAQERVGAARVPVQRSGLDGQELPFPDDSFDAALSTWTLCTIPDAVAALNEVHRVLKPGGRLHFVEHGLAPDPKVQRWQHRFNGMQQRLFGGCNLNRPIAQLLEKGRFSVMEIDEFYEKGAPKFVAAESLGTAVAALQAR